MLLHFDESHFRCWGQRTPLTVLRCQVEAAIDQAGQIDVLICCAGASHPGNALLAALFGMPLQNAKVNDSHDPKHAGRFLEQSLDVFASTMEVNFFGALHVLKAALPAMVERRQGEVVLVSSAAAVCGAQKTSKLRLSAACSWCAFKHAWKVSLVGDVSE